MLSQLLLVSAIIGAPPSPAEAETLRAAQRSGFFVSVAPKVHGLVGLIAVSRGPVSQNSAIVGGGAGLEIGLGRALSPGLALAWQGTLTLSGVDATAPFPYSKVNGVLQVDNGVVLHYFSGEMHYSGGAGLQLTGLAGGGADVASPDNILQQGAFWGPYLHARWAWCFADNFELGLGAVLGYAARDGQAVVPLSLSAGLSWLLF